MRRLPATLLCTLAATALSARAADPPAEFFESRVRPLLAAHCIECHGPAKQKGGLRLDSRAALLAGGDTGPAAKPGRPAESLLVHVTRYGGDVKMPPKGKLTGEQIAALERWVESGAVWPNDRAPAGERPAAGRAFDLAARAGAHWSFRPIVRPPVPVVPDARNPIDAFVLAKLRAAGLGFAPPADRRTLIRRLYFDLVGLPPTPEEVDAFAADPAPDAYETLVDRLLASPHYGERWARHWLDLVRFAETCGHEFDFEIPDAWRYRDYVVRAFNADLPYDRFLREHIAGDMLPGPRLGPDGNESLLATGWWFFHEALHAPVDSRADHAARIDNQIDVFGKAVLGLTVACARCHDHKFDAISQRDYYSLFGVLESSRYARRFIDDPATTAVPLDELKAIRSKLAGPPAAPAAPASAIPAAPDAAWRAASVAFESFGPGWRRRWYADGPGLRPEADGGAGFPHTGRELLELGAALRSRTFTIDRPILAVRAAGRNARVRVVLDGLEQIRSPIYGGLSLPIASGSNLHWIAFDLKMWKGHSAYLEFLDDGPGFFAVMEVHLADAAPREADSLLPPFGPNAAAAETAEAKALLERAREIESHLPPPRRAPGMADGNGSNERLFVRGSHKSLGEEVPRRNLEAFGGTPFVSPGSGRLELADALLDPRNPLVARVMVNRLWQHHFGEGIVRTPDDFGYQGQRPTHPELLDWLAAEFREGGWTAKRMHRLMVTSAAYRQSSRAEAKPAGTSADPLSVDPQNKLLHRQNVRRLEAEAIRDALLAVSGRLDRTLGGPGALPYLTEHEAGRGRPSSGPLDGNGRRSLYLQVRRNFLNPMFVAFDYPTPFTTIGRRSESNVPAQALAMLNNPLVLQQAGLWANRVLAEAGRTDGERVRSMYREAFGRAPSAAEEAAATSFLRGQAAEYGKPNDPRAWADLAHVLLNGKEFLFVE